MVRTARAAVVPYIVRSGTIYFLLGYDRKTAQITDFGGGVKKNESALTGALREFKEESKEIFQDLYSADKITEIGVRDKNMAALFIPLDIEWYSTASTKFMNTQPSSEVSNEISNIFWISEEHFRALVYQRSNIIWNRLRNFYRLTYTLDLCTLLRERYYTVFQRG